MLSGCAKKQHEVKFGANWTILIPGKECLTVLNSNLKCTTWQNSVPIGNFPWHVFPCFLFFHVDFPFFSVDRRGKNCVAHRFCPEHDPHLAGLAPCVTPNSNNVFFHFGCGFFVPFLFVSCNQLSLLFNSRVAASHAFGLIHHTITILKCSLFQPD